ncbi:hypothetical protein J2R98_001263 [Alkalibacillus filiformis]|uniref:Uncharacterized protein n=1 Tax=Alkalibacillus filiformis TaxID=200990 RepID=A0ABU0DSP1_9BACI|nr:YiiX/YebB-like N1pC/P60 family cysteine hydrolase [Alkalibacillus filiformis]MDQ0351449.1 hypothetical protein [Alkalibacillus filiformis]
MNPIVTGSSTEDIVTINIDLSQRSISYLNVFRSDQLVGIFEPVRSFHLRNERLEPITVECVFGDGTSYSTYLTFDENRQVRRPSDFKPGDILVASDNFGDVFPPGYIGHSAIVIDEYRIAESVTSHPQVRKAPIDNFLSVHTQVMHARPKDPSVGMAAAEYAKEYVEAYDTNLKQGNSVPEFSFSTRVPLNDPNDAIYCSKLVWLSYYYGADVEFQNNFYLFAPVDLKANIEMDDRFDVMYQHPEFDFKINLKL